MQAQQGNLMTELHNLQTQLATVATQTQQNPLTHDTLTQLANSLQNLNQNIVNLPRTDTVLARLSALEDQINQLKAKTSPPPNLLVLVGAVAVGAFIGAAVGASVVASQRQSRGLPPAPSSIAAVTISAHSR